MGEQKKRFVIIVEEEAQNANINPVVSADDLEAMLADTENGLEALGRVLSD